MDTNTSKHKTKVITVYLSLGISNWYNGFKMIYFEEAGLDNFKFIKL